MNKIIIFIALIMLISCVKKDGMTSDEFRDVPGILYYEKPETGRIVDVVFLPFHENKDTLKLRKLDFLNLKKGIKFGTVDNLIKDQLYLLKSERLILKGGLNRSVYLIDNVRILFHIDRAVHNGNDVISKDLHVDTLLQMNKYITLKYRYCDIVLDSLITY